MFQLDLLSLIPPSLKQTVRDVLVDFVADQAKKYAGDELATKIKKLRSDAAFNKTFEEGLQHAARRFVEEYKVEDEDLVVAIAGDKEFFKNEEIQQALLAVLRKPSAYLGDERDTLVHSFDTVLPQRLNRERVNRAVTYLLRCLAEELWHMPELQPVYSLQFQRVTAEATREQVAIQKAQLQALTGLNAGIREALLQLTDAIAEKKALPPGDTLALPTPPKPKVYHNLPQPDYGHFVGRDKELAQVARILRPYPHSQEHLVTIDGIGGIGKSALALEVAHRYLRNYDRIPIEERFEAIIWTSAKQTVLTAEGITVRRQVLRTLDDIYTAIAVALQREDITRARPEEQAEVVRQALTRQRTLLIVDNLETVDDEAVLTFLRELPAPTKAIVTTRHRLDVAYPVRLVGMPWEDAQQLIAQECQKKNVILNNDEARRLYDRTGGVPLALVWSIAQMGFGYGVEAVLIRLGQPTSDIARFCFEEALERIKDKPACKLLMTLALFATDTSREALGYVADLPELDRDEGLVILEKLSLLAKKEDRFFLLSLTKVYLRSTSEQLPELNHDLTLERMTTYFVGIVEAGYGRRNVNARSFGILEQELHNVLLVIDWCYSRQRWGLLLKIVTAIDYFMEVRGHWKHRLNHAEWGIEAGHQLDNIQMVAKCRLILSHTLYSFGNYQKAMEVIQQAKKDFILCNSEGGVAEAMRQEGRTLARLGDLTRATECYEQALQSAQHADTLEILCWLKHDYGRLARRRGDFQEAKLYFSEFLTLAKEIDDKEAIATAFGNLGWLALQGGDISEAEELYQKCLRHNNEIGRVLGIAYSKWGLSRIKAARTQYEDSRRLAEEAYYLFERIGAKIQQRGVSQSLNRLMETPEVSWHPNGQEVWD